LKDDHLHDWYSSDEKREYARKLWENHNNHIGDY